MSVSESHIVLTAQLYEVRRSMRVILADRYSAKIEEYKPVIRAVMSRDDCGPLLAALELVKDLKANVPDSDTAQGIIISAMIDMIEGE
jgi:hypothetical protein